MRERLERMTNPGYSALVEVIDCGTLIRHEIPWHYWMHPNGEVHPYLDFSQDMQGHYNRWLAHGVNVGEVLKGLEGPPPEGSLRIVNGATTGQVIKAASNFIRDEHNGQPSN